MADYALAIDLGGTKIASAVVTEDGKIISYATSPTEADKGGDFVLHRVKEVAMEALTASNLSRNDLVGVGMGTPGIIDSDRGIVLSESVNIPNWCGRQLKSELEHLLSIPASVDNDANVAALGEWSFGAGKGANNMVYVTIGTGVGGAVIANGQLLRGSNFTAGEIGHISINPNGNRCGCGGYGCLETFVSGPAIAQLFQEYIHRNIPTNLQGEINAKQIAEVAKEGDQLARFVLAEAGKYLGIALVGIANLLAPEKIVIGGGVAQAGELLLEPARWELKRRALKSISEAVQIVSSNLGTNAGLIGAAVLVFSKDR